MPGFSLSKTSDNNIEFKSYTYLFSHLFHLFFSICSDPLSLFYLIFFFPYLFKILSFLSPLFITKTLLIAALFTFTSPNLILENHDYEFSESQWGFLHSLCQSLMQLLRSKTGGKDEKFGSLDEFEAYLVMLQQSTFEAQEPKLENDCSEGLDAAPNAGYSSEGREEFGQVKELHVNSEAMPLEKVENLEATRPSSKLKKSLQVLFQEASELQDMCCQKEDEGKQLDQEFNNKVEECKENLYAKVSNYDVGGEYVASMKVKYSKTVEANVGCQKSNWEYSERVYGYNQAMCSNFGNFGAMRKEKEWKRTLACKLLEERYNISGSEGMGMLWETYEADSSKFQHKGNTRKENKSGVTCTKEEEEEEEEEKGEVEIESKLCCLQALKSSTEKMNLGMGTPNLIKISKALKAIGWLHHNSSRHGKKGK